MAFFILTTFVLVKYSRAFVERPSQGTSSLASRLTTVSLDLESACHDKQNGGPSFNLRARIAELWRFKARKLQNNKENSRLVIFKPGLWRTGFSGTAKNGTISSSN